MVLEISQIPQGATIKQSHRRWGGFLRRLLGEELSVKVVIKPPEPKPGEEAGDPGPPDR